MAKIRIKGKSDALVVTNHKAQAIKMKWMDMSVARDTPLEIVHSHGTYAGTFASIKDIDLDSAHKKQAQANFGPLKGFWDEYCAFCKEKKEAGYTPVQARRLFLEKKGVIRIKNLKTFDFVAFGESYLTMCQKLALASDRYSPKINIESFKKAVKI